MVTAQVRANGIDVLAVHPSPVASNFFDKAHKLESLDMAQKAAVSPASVPGKVSPRPCIPPTPNTRPHGQLVTRVSPRC